MPLSIRPAYRHGKFIGFCLFDKEPIGKAMSYKQVAILRKQLIEESRCFV